MGYVYAQHLLDRPRKDFCVDEGAVYRMKIIARNVEMREGSQMLKVHVNGRFCVDRRVEVSHVEPFEP